MRPACRRPSGSGILPVIWSGPRRFRRIRFWVFVYALPLWSPAASVTWTVVVILLAIEAIGGPTAWRDRRRLAVEVDDVVGARLEVSVMGLGQRAGRVDKPADRASGQEPYGESGPELR